MQCESLHFPWTTNRSVTLSCFHTNNGAHDSPLLTTTSFTYALCAERALHNCLSTEVGFDWTFGKAFLSFRDFFFFAMDWKFSKFSWNKLQSDAQPRQWLGWGARRLVTYINDSCKFLAQIWPIRICSGRICTIIEHWKPGTHQIRSKRKDRKAGRMGRHACCIW